MLIVARALQGISAAVVWTVGLVLVLDTVGSKKLGVTIGSMFSIISVGELMAPVLGGIVYEKAGYAAVFWMSFGILALDFVMRLAMIEKKTAAMYMNGEDDPEAIPEEDDEESPLLANGTSREIDWKFPNDLPKFVKRFPLLYCFTDSRLLAAEAVGFTQAALLAAFDATIPTEAQSLFSVDSLTAGLLFVPLVFPYLLLGSIAGKSVDRYGTKPAAVLGFAFLVLPLVLLRIPQAGGTAEMAKFCACLALCGVGLAFISAPSIVEASYVTEKYYHANKEFFGKEGPYAQLYAVNSMVCVIHQPCQNLNA